MPAETLASHRPGLSGPGRSRGVLAQLRHWPDSRVERLLGAAACLILLLIAGMIAFVFSEAWPSFSANGLSWFGFGGDVERQLEAIVDSPANPDNYVYELNAGPLLWGTAIVTFGAVAIGLAFALFAAIFIVEFAPPAVNRVLEPTVRLLAAVPSVVYGLVALLVIVPFVADVLLSPERRSEVINVVSLSGRNLTVGIFVLTIMITPIMIAIVVDALRAVPRAWTEGAAALGVNRWRVVWTIAVRTARPAIIAAAVLSTARALGEAIMLVMVAGSTPFAPNLIDGATFFFEPVLPLASAIVAYSEGLSIAPLGHTLYAFAAVLLVSSMFLSLGGYMAKQSMRRYGIRP